MNVKGIVFTLLILAIGGCADIQSKNFDRSSAVSLHKIAILGPSEWKQNIVLTPGDSGAVGVAGAASGGAGVAGTLGGGYHQVEQNDPITIAMRQPSFHLGRDLRTAIAASLTADGYEVYLPDQQPAPGEEPSSADIAKMTADAVLVSSIGTIIYGPSSAFSERAPGRLELAPWASDRA